MSESVECQEKSETKTLNLQKWEIVKELPSYERPPIPGIKHDHQAKILDPQTCQCHAIIDVKKRDGQHNQSDRNQPALTPLQWPSMAEKLGEKP